MKSLMIDGFTRILGRSQGYIGLPVKDTIVEDCYAMQTLWEPTPDELERLNRGKGILITMLTVEHPPIKVEVQE